MPTHATKSNVHLVVARVERQHALLEALRQRAPRPTTSIALGERLSVSSRTIERDIADLTAAGVRIEAHRGRGGGFTFDARSSLDPISFTPGEAAALVSSLVAVGPYSSAIALSALGKLLAAMTPS